MDPGIDQSVTVEDIEEAATQPAVEPIKAFDPVQYLKMNTERIAGTQLIVKTLGPTKYRLNWYDHNKNNLRQTRFVECYKAATGEVIVITPKQ